jgi:hypothetical protein
MTRKHVVAVSFVLLVASLFTVALSFVPVYIYEPGSGDLTYYSSIVETLGSSSYIYVVFEGIFGLLGFVGLLPFMRNAAPKSMVFLLLASLIVVVALYVASYLIGRGLFDSDPTKGNVGLALFL